MKIQVSIRAFKIIILIFFLWFWNKPSICELNYHYRYLTIDEGLPQNTVHAIMQDHVGFMWFGTGNGLSRFDGYNFVNFRSPDIPSNMVNALVQTRDNYLWIGTSEGLACLDYNKEIITKVELLQGLASVNIASLYLDHKGDLWVGTVGYGVFRYPAKENNNGQWFHFDIAEDDIFANTVNCFLQKKDGSILIGTNTGIFVYDERKETVYPFDYPSLGTASVLSLFESLEGDLWIGSTFNGAFVYNVATGRDEWYNYSPVSDHGLSHNRVNHINQDEEGTIYLSTLGGIDIYQPHTNSFISLPYKTLTDFSLNSIFVNLTYIDNQGNVWIGTEKGGVNYFSLYQKSFNFLTHDDTDQNSLSESTVNSIFADDDILWIGTAGGGLNKYLRQEKKIVHFRYDPVDDNSISSDYVTQILKISTGDLWIGTWGGGICKMHADGSFSRFIPAVANPQTNNENSFVSSLLYDDRGYLFIGTEGGLGIMDLHTEKFIIIDPAHNALAHIKEIGVLIKDSNNNIWAGTRNGLFKFSSESLDLDYDALYPERNLSVFRKNSRRNLPAELPGNFVSALLEDDNGNLWVGTHGDGLARFVKEGENILHIDYFTMSEGLSNNVIYSIEQDNFGYIWVSTDYGLSRINPSSSEIDIFFTDDGLLSNQFYWSASTKSASGELFFGNISGLNFFYPHLFPKYTYQPEVVLTGLRIYGEPIGVGTKRHGHDILDLSFSLSDEISLSYKDNMFSLEFSALDYFHPNKIRYSYRLEGVDREWINLSSDQRLASYSNLKGGKYLFRVKSTNSEGLWSNFERNLWITIRPPFWQTTWFLIGLLISIISGTIFYIRHHTKRLLLEKIKLSRMVSERTSQIESQNMQMREQALELQRVNRSLQKRKELIEGQKLELEDKNSEIILQRDQLISLNKEIESINQSRMKFFTNISHEFRTPLSLIISPVERLLKEIHLPGKAHEILMTVQRNARRLNILIDQLLQFRKIETGNFKTCIAHANFVAYVKEVFHAFDFVAQQRDIQYDFYNVMVDPMCWFDAEKVENILYNLLSNAFKYTPEGGNIKVVVGEQVLNSNGKIMSSLCIEVIDSGIGISDKQVERIFERFYQAGNGHGTRGFGIGLSLTRELVEALHGTIMLSKNENKGSHFIVTLPRNKEDLSGSEIIETPVFDNDELNVRVQALADNLLEIDYSWDGNKEEDKSKNKILVVEDNKELALFIANSLSDDYLVLVAENGKHGYETAKKEMPDIIISDVMMPEMDGIEMCRQIKNNLYTSHIPVIMLSAKALLDDQLYGIETGADDYISKPFNLDILYAKVKNMIEMRRKLRIMYAGSDELRPGHGKSETLDEKFLTRAYDILESSFANPEFNVEMFSKQMFVSRSLLYKKLKVLVDFSPNDFITIYRLKKSLPLLSSADMSINEVAYSVGFNDPKYFSRVFKKFYKKSPSEYFS